VSLGLARVNSNSAGEHHLVDPILVRGFRAGPYCGYVSHPADVKTGDGATDGVVIVVGILRDVEKRERAEEGSRFRVKASEGMKHELQIS